MAKSRTNPAPPPDLATAALSRRLVQMAKHIGDVKKETIAQVFDRLAGDIIATEYRASRAELDPPANRKG